MAQLAAVAGHHRALATLQGRQRTGDVALGGFVYHQHVEQPLAQRQHLVQVVQAHHPDGEGGEQARRVEFVEQRLLALRTARADRLVVAHEGLPVAVQQPLQAFDPQAVDVLPAVGLAAALAVAQVVEYLPVAHAAAHPSFDPGHLQPALPEGQGAALGTHQQAAPAQGLAAALVEGPGQGGLLVQQVLQCALLARHGALLQWRQLALQQLVEARTQGAQK